MRTLFILAIICFFSFNIYSQDTICKRNGQILFVKVLEVSSTEITYTRSDMIDGPVFRESKTKIKSISYSNGSKETFTSSKPEDDYTNKADYVNSTSSLVKTNIGKPRLTITVNILPLFFNERSLFIDYCYKERHSVGINVGKYFSNTFLNEFFKNSKWVAYSGLTTGLNYKYSFSKKQKYYVGAELIYKYLSYSGYTFIDSKKGNSDINYVRSETANVYGLDIMYGSHLAGIENGCDVDFYCGIGYRYRDRNYNTLSCSGGGFNGPSSNGYGNPNYVTPPKVIYFPLGTFHTTEQYPTIVLGLKIGVNVFFNKTKH